MSRPRVAVVSFPGMNCEVESLRSIEQAGMEAVFFRWNDDRARLREMDGYFLPGGFSYEDRGRSGMVPARDPVMDVLREEAEKGKAVVGNCNGAQILVESGLIPLDRGLRMSLARNAVGARMPGFLSEWVRMRRACAKGRCVTDGWDGVMHVPIAHGEGRFTTRDRDVIAELRKNDQIAFVYCDAAGVESADPAVTPNGSMFAIAGLCNPAGNVVAVMPHPERTPGGLPYFLSMKEWMLRARKPAPPAAGRDDTPFPVGRRDAGGVEIFIDTVIVNNEERTVEQALRRAVPGVALKQYRYIAAATDAAGILSHVAVFNPSKEIAYVRAKGAWSTWNPDRKAAEPLAKDLLAGIAFLRRDEPDPGANAFGKGSQTGVCYVCSGAAEAALTRRPALEVLCNPHASVLERFA